MPVQKRDLGLIGDVALEKLEPEEELDGVLLVVDEDLPLSTICAGLCSGACGSC